VQAQLKRQPTPRAVATVQAPPASGHILRRRPITRARAAEWVTAVNEAGGFGEWCWDVAFVPHEIDDIISRHAGA
jgi:hypothetical protein